MKNVHEQKAQMLAQDSDPLVIQRLKVSDLGLELSWATLGVTCDEGLLGSPKGHPLANESPCSRHWQVKFGPISGSQNCQHRGSIRHFRDCPTRGRTVADGPRVNSIPAAGRPDGRPRRPGTPDSIGCKDKNSIPSSNA